jgi:hypothetical protein
MIALMMSALALGPVIVKRQIVMIFLHYTIVDGTQ